ncbi:MAG: tRNA (adenosine(37)-N6)-threonylcarbamoyltransferase complex dimerization subunit type 1 TsaB [Pseudomonadota bacterium]
MKILAIDTSSPAGSVALAEDGRLIAELLLNVDYTHSRRLMRDVDLLLRAVNLELKDLDGFALTLGPGSFTGLRIGVATIKGRAMVADKPVAGVLTLDALAQNLFAPAGEAWALIDARKAEVFAARYLSEPGGMARVGEPLLLAPEELAARVPGAAVVLGSGVPICEDALRRIHPDLLVAPRHLWHIRGAAVCELGRRELESGHTEDLAGFGPVYLRPSETEFKTP